MRRIFSHKASGQLRALWAQGAWDVSASVQLDDWVTRGTDAQLGILGGAKPIATPAARGVEMSDEGFAARCMSCFTRSLSSRASVVQDEERAEADAWEGPGFCGPGAHGFMVLIQTCARSCEFVCEAVTYDPSHTKDGAVLGPHFFWWPLLNTRS